MTSIPKFEACDQDWSKMLAVQGGKMCGECNKKVVDMSRMRWKQIAQLHYNQPGICGLYTPKQVQNWGHEIPNNSVCSKAFAITSMMLTLAGAPIASHAQTVTELEVRFDCEPMDSTKALPTQSAPADIKQSNVSQTNDAAGCTIFKGYVKNEDNHPLPFTPVVILSSGTQIGGNYTDEQGFFEIDVTNRVDETSKLSMKTSYTGHKYIEITFDNSCLEKTTEVNVVLEKTALTVTMGILISRPTPMQRAGQKVFNMLRRFKY